MEDQLLKLPPFECETIPLSEIRQKWHDYKKQFEYVASAIGKKKKKKLKSIFLAVGGRQLQKVYESLPANENQIDDDFESTIKRLDEYFAPKRHDTFERYSFWSLIPLQDETLDKFLLRAKTHASKCRFGSTDQESQDAAVIDKIVMLAPPDLRRKILEKSTIDLDSLTKLVNSHLSVQQQVRELGQCGNPSRSVTVPHRNSDSPVYGIMNKPEHRWPNKPSNRPEYREANETHYFQENRFQRQRECSKCGGKQHRFNEDCPAKTLQCRNCRVYGHFARMCQKPPYKRKFESSNTQRGSIPAKKFKVNAVEENQSSAVEQPEARSDSFIFAISDNHDELVWCKVGDVIIEMMIDSGSKYNIIGESTWTYLQNKGANCEDIKQSDKSLSAYAQNRELKILCTFSARIMVIDSGSSTNITACFYVVKGGEQNLLGRETAKQLGVLLIGLPSVINSGAVQQVSECAEKFPKIKG